MESFQPKTRNGYDLFECSSALQKAIRRGEENVAMFFAVELFNSSYDEYVWKRLKVIVSEDVGLAEPDMPQRIAALYDFYVEQKKKKDEKHQPERLFMCHAVIMLCRANKSRLIDWALKVYWLGHDQNLIDIPDYAYDKHNLKGRRMGRGEEHFFTEGSKLENHTPLDFEEDYKETAYKLKVGDKKASTDDAIQDTLGL